MPAPAHYKPKAVAIVNKSTIIERVARGDMLRDIASDLGVSPAAISQYLSTDPEYRAARMTGAQSSRSWT